MWKNAVALASGILFGLGLSISQLVNPEKVLAFLDITNDWDPSLVLLMGAAVLVSGIAFPFVIARSKPVLGSCFDFAEDRSIDYKLILGAAIFGIGWGLAGYCPGPVIASLVWLNSEALVFIPAMFFGAVVCKYMFKIV